MTTPQGDLTHAPIKNEETNGWLVRPQQLINTAIQVVVSDLIGTRFDSRREQALAAAKQEQLIDYRASQRC